jgi:hypothetical protein
VTIENSYPGLSEPTSAAFPEFQFLSDRSCAPSGIKRKLESSSEKNHTAE